MLNFTYDTKKLYWLGNSAKTKIIYEVLESLKDDKETLIFDYGCGNGGDWKRILSDYSNINLICYEPDIKRFLVAKNKLKDTNVDIYTGKDIDILNFKADIIISFSVFEHVYDRKTYLRNANKLLAPDGLFYLNYDDGHFRNLLNLNRPELWFSQIKTVSKNILSKYRLSYKYYFQKRVNRDEIDLLIVKTGFKEIAQFYSNLESFKNLFKFISTENKYKFASLWLEMEDLLNQYFLEYNEINLGDNANLWQCLPSRTILLKHAVRK